MARALVLGATGHIGAHIVRALLSEGHSVRAAYRKPDYLSVLEGLSLERVRVDLSTLEGLGPACADCDWIFHAAGYYPSLRQNRAGAMDKALTPFGRALETIAAARPRRVVFTSSAATVRRVPGRASSETDAEPWPLAEPRPVYATVKTAMEHEALAFARRSGLPLVVVNPSVCVGEHDAHAFSGRVVLIFAKHKLPFVIEHNLNVVYTGDVGVGHLRAAERGSVGERYLLCGQNLSLREFAGIVAEEARVRLPLWTLPRPAAFALAAFSEAAAWATRGEPVLPRQTVHRTRGGQVLDGAKALRELGMPRTPVREAVRRALAWFREHGHLKSVL